MQTELPRTPYDPGFYPMLVGMPIGVWIASLVFDVASRATTRPAVFATGAFWLIVVGLVGLVAASAVSAADLLRAPRTPRERRTRLLPVGLNALVVALFVVGLLHRWPRAGAEPVPYEDLILSVVALVLVCASGWITHVLAEGGRTHGPAAPGQPHEA